MGKIADDDAFPFCGVFGNGTPHTDFDIIGMGSKGQDIDWWLTHSH